MNYPTGKNSYEYRRDSFYDIVYERGYSVKSGEKYNTVHDSITLICDTHGEFTIIPKRFKRSVKGCYKCGYEYMAELQRKNRDEFIEDCIDVLGSKYDFSEFEYINSKYKGKVICPEHGEFYKTPGHLYRGQGCPKCLSHISMGEKIIIEYLEKFNIKFTHQYKISKDKYLKNKPYDFLINDINLLIEFNGEQHYKCKWSMTKEDLDLRKEIDLNKKNKAIELGYEFLVIKYNDDIKEKINYIVQRLSKTH